MKFFVSLLCIILSIHNASAQLLQLQDPVSSKNFNPEKYAGVRGTPFLSEKWIHGKVLTKKGVYENLELKIDGYDDVVYFNKDDESFELLEDIISVKLYPKWPDTSVKQYFIRGINKPNIKPSQYVQVLIAESGPLQLLRSDIKQVSEMSEINAGMVKTFTNFSRYFIVKNGEYNLVKLNKEAILAVLTDKVEKLQEFMNTNKLTCKKEADLIQIINFYNQLTN